MKSTHPRPDLPLDEQLIEFAVNGTRVRLTELADIDEAVRRMAARGLSMEEVAWRISVPTVTVASRAQRLRIRFRGRESAHWTEGYMYTRRAKRRRRDV